MGKGSKARPLSVDGQEFADNWDKIFNKTAVDDAADVMSGVDPINEDPEPPFFRNEDGMLAVELDDLLGKTNFELAGDFMTAFGQEVLTEPTLPSTELAKLRLELIREEFEELTVATNAMDMIEIADALTDILYVVYGAGHAFGIDLDACYAEVHNSNMSKLGEDGKPIYREDGKVMKGPNFRAPDLSRFCQ
jgi:predicted HAD superfamily Cof-like phosphohydrolase